MKSKVASRMFKAHEAHWGVRTALLLPPEVRQTVKTLFTVR
jgi:hypothetical protein